MAHRITASELLTSAYPLPVQLYSGASGTDDGDQAVEVRQEGALEQVEEASQQQGQSQAG